jgi:hypothetical protein
MKISIQLFSLAVLAYLYHKRAYLLSKLQQNENFATRVVDAQSASLCSNSSHILYSLPYLLQNDETIGQSINHAICQNANMDNFLRCLLVWLF